jgi:hypothetical protein
MTKVNIQLISKNNSTRLGEPLVIMTDYVPRIGELIDVEKMTNWEPEQNSIFIINSSVNKLTTDGFIPHLIATEYFHGKRSEFLEEFGWLPQTNETSLRYDEDNYFPGD